MEKQIRVAPPSNPGVHQATAVIPSRPSPPAIGRKSAVVLGHATITSTEIYIHVSLEDLKEVVRRAHPYGRKE